MSENKSTFEQGRQEAKFDLILAMYYACGAGILEDGTLAQALHSSGFGQNTSSVNLPEHRQEIEFHFLKL